MRSQTPAAILVTALLGLAACGGGNDTVDVLDSPPTTAPVITVPPDPVTPTPPSGTTGEVGDDRVWVCASDPDNGREQPVVYSDAACPTDRSKSSELGESGILVRWYHAGAGTPVPPVGASLPDGFTTDE